jgi:hypothetical protein
LVELEVRDAVRARVLRLPLLSIRRHWRFEAAATEVIAGLDTTQKDASVGIGPRSNEAVKSSRSPVILMNDRFDSKLLKQPLRLGQ